jgi:glyoxylase-like metal-dependent hydrolase (beta-lactamase superfamily II)
VEALSCEVIVAPASDSARYEVLAVRYGTRSTRKSDVFLHFDLYGEPDAEMRMDYFFWIARNAERTIMIDCGFNERSGRRRGRTMLCPPVTALRRLGIAPADVGLLIATHAHYDHIGNLEAFPAAEVIMSAREYDFWTGPFASRPLFATSAEADDIELLRRAREAGRLRFTSGWAAGGELARECVADGVDVLEVGGHTPGQLIAVVGTEDGEAVIASDALHYYEEMRLDRPFLHVADLPAMYAGFELLRDLQAGGTRHLVAGHDPEVMRRFPPLAAAEAHPGPDGLAGLAVRIGPALTDAAFTDTGRTGTDERRAPR